MDMWRCVCASTELPKVYRACFIYSKVRPYTLFYKQWFFRPRLKCCFQRNSNFPKIGLTLPDKKVFKILVDKDVRVQFSIFSENWQNLAQRCLYNKKRVFFDSQDQGILVSRFFRGANYSFEGRMGLFFFGCLWNFSRRLYRDFPGIFSQ